MINLIQKMDFSQWQVERLIYKFGQTKVQLLKKDDKRVIRKQITLTNENRNYAKYELKLMKEINHPFVVKLLHSEEINQFNKKKIILYMNYYENQDLQKFIKTHQIDLDTKARMFIDILQGIKQLHSKFIIHRDIKLKNIFVDENYRCIIGDLGIATKSVDSAKSKVGPHGLFAPQVYSKDCYNEKVDIWGLGIIAYQLFNGKRDGKIAFPFLSPQLMRPNIIKYGDSVDYELYMNFTNKIEPIDEDLPAQIKQMIVRMLKNKPTQRISWVQFYKAYYLQTFDLDYRLCTFMAEYKEIDCIKQTLKQHLQFFQQHKEKYFYKLQQILHHEKIEYFKEKYPFFKANLIDIHIIHLKLMKRSLDRYNYIIQKKIYKYVLDWKDFIKTIKNQIHLIEHRINYRLRNNSQQQIKNNPKYITNQYYRDTLQTLEKILDSIEETDFQQKQ